MKLTFLGTGTSHGVPVIACDCEVCKSKDPRDKRTRSAAYIETNDNKYILIDIGPDFREQALRENIRQIDAVLLTHSHADHLHGIDDLRNFSCIMSNKPDNPQNEKYARPPIPIYTNKATAQDIKNRFSYLFSAQADGGGHAKIQICDIAEFQSFHIGSAKITEIPILHGKLKTSGWLLTENQKSVAYLTDCNEIRETSFAHIKNLCAGGRLVHLIIDGLRIKPHSTHFNFQQALQAAANLNAEHVWFTHLTHNSSHEQTQAYLDEHRKDFPQLAQTKTISPAYDGLVINTI
ncbi:MAG: MBL fold metallo-hydrolase [Treponema sp.]|nr:MBL fold metallo-hydrolase [Treponema sp.]